VVSIPLHIPASEGKY